jgi:heat shock protein HtpX
MGEAFGLYTHIRNNRLRSMFLVAGLFVLVGLITYALVLMFVALRYSAPLASLMNYAYSQFWAYLPLALGLTGLWVGVGYAFNTRLVAWATDAQDVTRESHPELYRLTENLCISRGMRVPKLQIIDTPALNAFASGVNDAQYTVTVTTGLMEALDKAELEAVVAHELTHIRNGDVRLMIFAILIAGIFAFFGEMILRRGFRIGSSSSDEKGSGRGAAMIIAVVIILVAWFLSVVIRFSLSRTREFLADAGAVELTKNPDAMISALLKISGRADIEGVPSGIMDMCIENDPGDFADIFSTHPSISKRVQALQSYAGGLIPQAELPRVENRESLPELVERRGPWARKPQG